MQIQCVINYLKGNGLSRYSNYTLLKRILKMIHPTLIFSYIISFFKKHQTVSFGLLMAILSSVVTMFFVSKSDRETYLKQIEQTVISTTQKVQIETEQKITEKYTSQIASLTAQYESKLHEVTTTETTTTKKKDGEIIIVKKQKIDRQTDNTSVVVKNDIKQSNESTVVKKDRKVVEQTKTDTATKITESKTIEQFSWSVHALITQDNLSLSSVQIQPRYGILVEKNISVFSIGVLGSYRPDNTNVGIGVSIGFNF